MNYLRWFRLLVAALVLQLGIVEPLSAQGELSFSRLDFQAGGGVSAVTVGDFNGDGRQDLATGNFSPFSPTVSILLGEGDGSFEPAQNFLVGNAPFTLTVGDFNGDGQQDVATANQNGNFHTVSVLLGRGDGTFEPAQNIELGVGVLPVSITVGDFNGDSQQDLATASGIAGVSILLGRGDGTFEFEGPRRCGGGVQVNPYSINVGDFNGDSQQDLATAGTIFLGNGDGTFELGQSLGITVFSATVGDFNGDGQQDLATADANTDSVSILPGQGDGTFEPPQVFWAGDAISITVGDFNGDGQQDVATANTNGLGDVSILLGQGDGTFEHGQSTAVWVFPSGPQSITSGDFNGDGRQDVATTNQDGSRVAILINNTPDEMTTYRLTRIGDEVFNPIIHDINVNGEMVGSTRGINEPRRAILLRDGVVTELGDLPGGATRSAAATAINDLFLNPEGAQVTGTNDVQGASGNVVTRGVLWGLSISDLGIDPGASPLDINNRGQIVGVSVSADNIARPFVFGGDRKCPIPSGTFCFLETLFPGNLGGTARAINDSGNGGIVGSSNSPVGRRAVRWQDGGITPLEPPFVLEVGEAVDVNERGEVIGFYFNSSAPQMATALLWQGCMPPPGGGCVGGTRNTVTVLPPLDHPEAIGAIPTSISGRGQIVGHTHLGTGQSLATLWRRDEVLDLNALVSDDDPAKPFVTLASAIKITDFGLIVASGTDSREPEPRDTVYYLLTPTAAPASSAAVPRPSASSPSPSVSSPRASDNNGGGAVDRFSLLLLLAVMSVSAAHMRRRQRAVPA